jgi:TRAP-type C4-dicarboxylate transport system substrate-binding protein
VDLNYIAISEEVFQSMTPEQQATLQAAADAAAEAGRVRQLELEGELVAFLEGEGMEVYEPDTAAFREAVQGAYLGSEFAETWPEGVLDQINALGAN